MVSPSPLSPPVKSKTARLSFADSIPPHSAINRHSKTAILWRWAGFPRWGKEKKRPENPIVKG
jgi:hypothetical protein